MSRWEAMPQIYRVGLGRSTICSAFGARWSPGRVAHCRFLWWITGSWVIPVTLVPNRFGGDIESTSTCAHVPSPIAVADRPTSHNGLRYR